MNMRKLMALAAICVAAASPSLAGLVAKWDFDNYDSENPTSAAILVPTVGSLAAIPCTGTTASTAVTDGTLGDITVLAPSETGLSAGDYALAIPKDAHLKLPIPSGIIHDKPWMLRIRFCSPAASAGKLRILASGNPADLGSWVWSVSAANLIYGHETHFGRAAEENSPNVSNGSTIYRSVSSDKWNSFAAYFGPSGATSTLNGFRSVSMTNVGDIRSQFTGDNILVCAGSSSELTYIASVELWDDIPVFHDASGGAYVPKTSRKFFTGCSLDVLRDLYISAKGLGSWGPYARSMASWEHIVTSDGAGNPTDLKVDLRGEAALDAVVLCDFTDSGDDVDGSALRMQYGRGWPNHYFTDTGAFVNNTNAKDAGTVYNYNGYAAYNLYALPFKPLGESLSWSMQMGYGKFGNPFFTIVGDNPTLTFDVAPQADSLTFDCGRGDGKAAVTLAYSSDALKTMSSLGDIKVRENVTITIPAGVSITGSLMLDGKASLVVNSDGMALANRDVVFTAAEGITIPSGVAIGDVATIAGGTIELSTDGTQLIFLENSTVPVTATWVGLGDRDDVLDPLNWQCLNANGTVLVGALPTVDTAITVSGETTFNLPTNQASRLQYRSFVISSCSLTADCDWRGFGASIPYSATPTIDLKEHKLYVSDVASAVVVTNSLTGEPGEYHIDIAAYATLTGPRMQGNVRLVKEGTAELLLNYAVNPTYTGGTEIHTGRIASTLNATQKTQFGKSGSEIIVRSGTMLYLYNNENWLTLYPIVMDGGSIYTWWSSANGVIVGSMRLLANSSLDVNSGGKLHIWTGHTVNLNGHTLALTGAGEKCLSASGSIGVTFTEGIVDLQNGTMSLGGVVNAVNTTFYVGGALNLGGNTLNVSNYVARYTGTANAGTGAMNVYGTFKDESGKFYGCTMQNGSTIDLSGREDAQPATSAFTTGNNKMSFASGAAVTLYLGSREVADGDKLIDWDEDIGTLTATFAMKFADGTDTAEQRELVLELRPNGVYVKSTATPDYAIWDVEGNRWRFYKNDVEMPWDGGVGESIQVRFSTAAEYAGLLTNNVTPSAYVLTTNHFTNAAGTTLDLIDGIRFFFEAGTVIDVNGGTLKMPASITDGGAKAFTVTSSAEGGVFELNVPEGETVNNTAITLTGSLKFVKSGPGLFVSARGQNYTGGNELRDGTVKVSLNATQHTTMGASGKDILVREDATLQLEGQVWYTVYKIILDGGTLQTGFSEALGRYTGGAIFGPTTLLADSTFRTTESGTLRLWGTSVNAINLGEHTLDVELSASGSFLMSADDAQDVVITNGTMNVSGGTFKTYPSYYGTVNATTLTMRMNGAMSISDACTVNLRDYEALYDGTANTGTGAVNVSGTFKPSAHDKFYGVTMQSGSTIDLSSRTNALPLVSAFTTGANTLKFADNSTVYINAGNLKVGSKSPVITWDEKPENIRTVKFKNADTGSSRTFVSRDNGVYGISGFVIIVR